MELLRFIVNNVLGPVFGHDLAMVRARVNNLAAGQDGNPARSGLKKSNQRANSKHKNFGDATLDPDGPKLLDGFQSWLVFYQITGFINMPGAPIYVSMIYRLGAFLLAHYIMNTHFVMKVLFSQSLNINLANPIFVLLGTSLLLMATINMMVIFYTCTFNLGPLFKILSTSRLCYVNRRSQNAFGAHTLKYMLVLHMYHCVLYRMMVHDNFEHFIHQFNLLEFLLEYCATIVYIYNFIGLAHVDFYVRFCFGAWLLALKANLECRRARSHRLKQQQWNLFGGGEQPSGQHARPASAAPTPVSPNVCRSPLFVSLDDIQKSLNAMDDHLEVTRSIQTISLVMINLLSFFGCGIHFLIAYDVLAKSNDLYHGTILVLVSLNYAFLVMLTYAGDGFINYALDKLVQTVEDEYFLQDENGPEQVEQVVGGADLSSLALTVVSSSATIGSRACANEHSPPIKRSDVLFCREFIVQFEDHLATPWSRLNFKSHLHIMATFATLIAAQIIFDSH